MKRVSVDIGGTFTDCFVVWDNQYIEGKALTTHRHNLALGFNEALANACEQLGVDVLHCAVQCRFGALRHHAGHQRPH